MRFARFKYLFLSFSLLVGVSFYAVTYGCYEGFARSLTFNGGIRFSIRMPAAQGKAELLAAAEKSGFEGAKVRLTSVRSNIWDLELGPDIREEIEQLLQEQHQQSSTEAAEQVAKQTTPPAAKQATPQVAKQTEEQAAKQAAGQVAEQVSKQVEVTAKVAGGGKSDIGISEYIEERLLPALAISPESIVSRETIAASYGENLSGLALQIMIYAIIAIGIYLTFRFDFPFAVGASFALVHDLVLSIGFIGLMQIEPSIPVLAAVLTIIGYSINDTIVIFDRIRENSESREQATLEATVNLAITQTLSRTSITSMLTLLAVLALLIGGEASLRDFAVVLLFGVGVGTYSSICVAVPVVQVYEQFRNRKQGS